MEMGGRSCKYTRCSSVASLQDDGRNNAIPFSIQAPISTRAPKCLMLLTAVDVCKMPCDGDGVRIRTASWHSPEGLTEHLHNRIMNCVLTCTECSGGTQLSGLSRQLESTVLNCLHRLRPGACVRFRFGSRCPRPRCRQKTRAERVIGEGGRALNRFCL